MRKRVKINLIDFLFIFCFPSSFIFYNKFIPQQLIMALEITVSKQAEKIKNAQLFVFFFNFPFLDTSAVSS